MTLNTNNSDKLNNSEDKELYFLNESRSYNKDFKFYLERTTDQNRLDLEFSFNSNYNNSWNP